MKRHLLFATVASLGLLAMPAAPAHADLPVIDVTEIGHMLESIGIEGDQLTQLIQTYQEIVQVYGMAKNIWSSVAELVGADQWAPGLNTDHMRNPLPYIATNHPGVVGGFTDPSFMPFGAQYLSQNSLGGDPTAFNDSTFNGTEIFKAIRSFSSIQAVANGHLQQIESRIGELGTLFGQLAKIGTIQETDSLSARLNNELNFANSQNTQAMQTMSSIMVQRAVFENNQRQYSYLDEHIAANTACATAQRAVPAFASVAVCQVQLPWNAGGGGGAAGPPIFTGGQ
jgi:hypothetical protein